MDMKAMMRQAQKMQVELAKAQEEIKNMTAEATAGGPFSPSSSTLRPSIPKTPKCCRTLSPLR